MFPRLLKLPGDRSCLLFGAGGTGKRTLVRQALPGEATRTYDLADPDTEDRLARDPLALEREVLGLPAGIRCVVLEEVQRVPPLLEAVRSLMEGRRAPQSFVLTGSSARMFRAGGANPLAGRAALRLLFPLLRRELGPAWELERALAFGGLPEVWNLAGDAERTEYLRAYAHAYLREQIRAEQAVRRLDPFRRFLQAAARGSGQILNYSRIAREVGADVKTVQGWYGVLEDTFLGFFVAGCRLPVRRQLRQAAKFYLFDPGVARALGLLLAVPPEPGTRHHGELFEQLVLAELHARSAYGNLDWRFSHLRSRDGVAVDLVLDRPGRPTALVQITGAEQVREEHGKSLRAFQDDFPDAELFLLSRDPRPRRMGRIRALPWEEGLEQFD